ncbi:MAG: hypothetical protein ACLRZ7_01605 [Lachnospiraceae bacterium]
MQNGWNHYSSCNSNNSIFLFAKAAGYADERLEEIHNAFVFKEDMQYEGHEEI